MNYTQTYCLTSVMDSSNFTFKQLVNLTVFNVFLISVNIITNASVIYILIKTEQISNVTCKLILFLSISDILIGVVAQPLYTLKTCFTANCLFATLFLFVTVFLTHMSGYLIAIIGIDRYFRVKYFVNFKTIWTTRVVLVLSRIGFFLALIQALMITIGALLKKGEVTGPIYIAVDITIIVFLILLQLHTIRRSNALDN